MQALNGGLPQHVFVTRVAINICYTWDFTWVHHLLVFSPTHVSFSPPRASLWWQDLLSLSLMPCHFGNNFVENDEYEKKEEITKALACLWSSSPIVNLEQRIANNDISIGINQHLVQSMAISLSILTLSWLALLAVSKDRGPPRCPKVLRGFGYNLISYGWLTGPNSMNFRKTSEGGRGSDPTIFVAFFLR